MKIKECQAPETRQQEAVILVEQVSFAYDTENPHDPQTNSEKDSVQLVLHDFSLTVVRGEFVTLTGRTGVGKSTLFKLLLGLYQPSKGQIRINGISPAVLPDQIRRRMICCVEQKVSTVPGTIRDQVTLGDQAFRDESIWQALEIADLKDTVAAIPGQLDAPYQDGLFSQGQKQLLMIARAIVSDPDILLLDEITAGLDTATEKMILSALQRASRNRTVLSISHRLSQVMPGRIVEM